MCRYTYIEEIIKIIPAKTHRLSNTNQYSHKVSVRFLACRSRNGTCYDIGHTWDEKEPGICVKYKCVKHMDGHKSDIVAQSEPFAYLFIFSSFKLILI